jgi:DNA-binding MarR family transcriptional regulator
MPSRPIGALKLIPKSLRLNCPEALKPAREQCENDARGFDVVLTKAGLKAIQAAAPKHLEAVRHCFIDLLSLAQMKTLTSISERVAERLKEEHAQEE